MTSTAPSLASFAPAILARDFTRLAELFDPNIELQALTPSGFRQATGAEAAANWYVEWFGPGLDQEILVNEVFTVGAHSGLRFRLRRRLGSTPETATWYVIEQHAFMDVGPLGIERIAMVCSGHTPEPVAAPPGTVHEFDAGNLGCSEGFPQAFLRRVRAIEIGEVLRITTSDPSARQDLPALARMNGHTVTEPETLADGRICFRVERRR